jgi:DNA polymerase I-like protein with 3'-5' exonuclease and polymerase domains
MLADLVGLRECFDDVVRVFLERLDPLVFAERAARAVRLVTPMTVHDELVYEVADDVAAKVLPKIKEIMENIVSPEDWKGLPLVVNSSVGKNWGEMK